MRQPCVLYCAPGSGLGHLNRALAVCLELRALGVRAQIVSNSPFAAGLAQLARFPIVEIPPERWRADIREFVLAARPKLMVCDTFPRGLRGEWSVGLPAPAVYMARRLKLDAVVQFLGESGWPDGLVQIIAAEDLASEHEAALLESRIPICRLPGRIRLRPEELATEVPTELDRLWIRGAACWWCTGGRSRKRPVWLPLRGCTVSRPPSSPGRGRI
ncbi:MAG: hypothetical protein QM757_31620 [Paludibaculum sp.]